MKKVTNLKLTNEDKKILDQNYNEIVLLGLKEYKRINTTEIDLTDSLSYTEQIMFNVLLKYATKNYITKHKLIEIYNKQIIKQHKPNQLKVVNLPVKIHRINSKLDNYTIINKHDYGYKLLKI